MESKENRKFIKGESRLAIDCGGVMSFKKDWGKGSLIHNIKNSKISKHCLQSVKQLVKLFGKENTFVLSKKRNDKTIIATAIMLRRNNFYKKTGFSEENVYFCSLKEGGENLERG